MALKVSHIPSMLQVYSLHYSSIASMCAMCPIDFLVHLYSLCPFKIIQALSTPILHENFLLLSLQFPTMKDTKMISPYITTLKQL